MMDSVSEEEEHRFFDAQDEVASVSDLGSDCLERSDSLSLFYNSSWFQYDMWIRSPISVEERRNKFLNWMGLRVDPLVRENLVDRYGIEIDRVTDRNGAVLRNSSFEKDEFCSSRSTMSSLSHVGSDLTENFVCGVRGSDELEHDCNLSTPQHVDFTKDFENSSPPLHQLSERSTQNSRNLMGLKKRIKKWWLYKLRSMTCIVDDKQGEANTLSTSSDTVEGTRVQRVRVRQFGKKSKELSAFYRGQEIQAHEGSILTMKFSPDGHYLASGGEDGIIRLWQVVEDERSNEVDLPDIDPSCVYFTANHPSELTPLSLDNGKTGKNKIKSMRQNSDSACVVLPPKVFRIVENPLHQFQGHSGEILDLSWSENNYILSSSVDNTVRLWRVGCDQCLKVFSHNNYVTCVQFNPVNNDYFISGSIDGKVRIWAISSCQVVDWTDIKDIVTAVCYHPDGQRGIVGSMTGDCRFYNITDNQLQLDAQICLCSKKKSPCKRITGFQFLPQDSSKVMVTCADSQVRILHGMNVIGKYRGMRNSGNQIYASFTSDGRHIISACEDSSIYIWNCLNQKEDPCLSQSKKIRSHERFSSSSSIAIPWPGFKYDTSRTQWQFRYLGQYPSPACFSLTQEFFLESFCKNTATWPEEKLPALSPLSFSPTMHKSQYRFLKSSCQSTSNCHAWGLVIITAGYDGRIRSFHNYGLPVPP